MADKGTKRGRGRPGRPVVTLPAEPEEIARRFFAPPLKPAPNGNQKPRQK